MRTINDIAMAAVEKPESVTHEEIVGLGRAWLDHDEHADRVLRMQRRFMPQPQRVDTTPIPRLDTTLGRRMAPLAPQPQLQSGEPEAEHAEAAAETEHPETEHPAETAAPPLEPQA